ncbi:MAG: alpha/beta fold hydrolase [Myxococcota bacterium]
MSRLAQTLKGTFLLVLAGVGSWIVYSAVGMRRDRPLPPAVDAPRRSFSGQAFGRVSYYVDENKGKGTPLLLIHSVNAAGSAYEMRPIFQHYQGTRPVYAMELPGFGFSERAARTYTPETFFAAVQAMLTEEIGEPADVVALSLGAEFAAMAALRAPGLVRSLTLIAPTGFGQSSPQGSDTLALPFRIPLVNQAIYDLLVTRWSIKYFLGLSFLGPIPDDLIEYGVRTGRQPGAANAPYSFVSGCLFTPDVRQKVYARVSQPTLVLYNQSGFVGYDRLPGFVWEREHWQSVELKRSKDLPQFEEPDAVFRQLDRFWSSSVTTVSWEE